MKIQIKNLKNDNGNYAQNQFIVRTNNATYFQSYDSVVCKIDKKTGNVVLSCNWDYSQTTMKHLYMFFRQMGHCGLSSKANVVKKIKEGEIILKKVSSLNIV